MHRDEQRLDLAEDRETYEAPAATDIGAAEEHTHGPSTQSKDNPDGPHQGFKDDK